MAHGSFLFLQQDDTPLQTLVDERSSGQTVFKLVLEGRKVLLELQYKVGYYTIVGIQVLLPVDL